MSQPINNLPAPFASVLRRYDAPAQRELPTRKSGRPRKRTREYFQGLLAEHTRLVAWFANKYGATPVSDRQLYTEFFADQFCARGDRAGRAKSAEFQRTLKTLRNELAEARRIARASPENQPIYGTRRDVE